MAYNKTVWVNDTAPAINADNLNKIENELEYLDASNVGSVHKNLTGTDKAYYPVNLPRGTNITMSTSDGSLMPSTIRLNVYNSSKSQLTYYNFTSGLASRTVTVNVDGAVYLRWNEKPPVPLQVEIGDSATSYEKYFYDSQSLDALRTEDIEKKLRTYSHFWEVGGLGSNGKDYDQRDTSIRTLYLGHVEYVNLTHSVDASICLYDGSGTFVARLVNLFGLVDVYALHSNYNFELIRVEALETTYANSDYIEIGFETIYEESGYITPILENGTIITPSNANAINISKVPCKYGDWVEFNPVRPNTDGYYYTYGYSLYDINGSLISQETTAAKRYKRIYISNVNVKFVRFFIVEYNGTSYNPLRVSTYGYTPYVSYPGEVGEEIPEDAEVLSEWKQGGITDGADSSSNVRIRTGYISLLGAEQLLIVVQTGYWFALTFYDEDKNFVSTSSEWQTYSQILYANPDFKNVAYLRVALRKSSNGTIVPADGTNISGLLRTLPPIYDSLLTLNDKIDRFSRFSQNDYNNLLSQAKFSPSGAKVLTLMHFSDIHDNSKAMSAAMDLYQTFNSKIDDMVHTGDVVKANYSDGLTNWIDSGCAAQVISVIGNHDSEENLVLGTAGKENVYNGMLKPYIGNWGVVQPSGVDDSTSGDYCACYYYKNYSDVKIRLVVLDSNWWDDYQKTWLANVLDDALTNEYSIIFAVHTPRFVTGVTDANFCSYTEPIINEPASFANIPNDWLDPVNDFIEGGGEVICMLSGHNHRDHFGYLTLYPDILCMTADKASVARTIDTARITGESNQYAFNVITFNPTEKWIKLVRFGAEVDGEMRGKHVFSYDYANKRILAQW